VPRNTTAATPGGGSVTRRHNLQPGLKITHTGQQTVSVEIRFGPGLRGHCARMMKPARRRPDDPNAHLPTTTSATPESSTKDVDGQGCWEPGRVDRCLMTARAEGMDGESVRWEVGESVGHAASLPGCAFLGKVLQLKSKMSIGG